jgi:hypothetical protein
MLEGSFYVALQLSGDGEELMVNALLGITKPIHVLVHGVTARKRCHLIRNSSQGGGKVVDA